MRPGSSCPAKSSPAGRARCRGPSSSDSPGSISSTTYADRLRRFWRAIEDATLTSRVTAVDGDVVSLRLEGWTKAVQKGDWSIRGFDDMNRPSDQERGLEMKLLGSARFDRKQRRFVGFEVVAVGTRWGGTQYNC